MFYDLSENCILLTSFHLLTFCVVKLAILKHQMTILHFRDSYPPYFLTSLSFAVIALTILGTIGNIMTFIVVITKELRELSLGIYMAFLAIFDTLTLICGFVW